MHPVILTNYITTKDYDKDGYGEPYSHILINNLKQSYSIWKAHNELYIRNFLNDIPHGNLLVFHSKDYKDILDPNYNQLVGFSQYYNGTRHGIYYWYCISQKLIYISIYVHDVLHDKSIRVFAGEKITKIYSNGNVISHLYERINEEEVSKYKDLSFTIEQLYK